MDASLTLAKITVPLMNDIVERSRLLDALEQAHERPITWVSGPGGSGKTTLVTNYVHRSTRTCLWYQLDRGDGDPAAPFHYLRLAAQTIKTRSRRPLPPEFAPEFMAGLDVFSRRFFRDLFARLPSPFVVVFDNVQDAPTDSPLYSILREGLLELPSGGQAILLSRTEPPAIFSRFIAGRQMAQIGWADLRFTEAETLDLLNLFGQEARLRDQMQSILSVTEGWVAGVVLMALVADQLDLPRLTPNDAPVQNLFDYFAGEVLRKVDAADEHFLLRSAFLPEMTVPLAEDITANPEAGKVLARLNRKNFFTNRRSGRQPIYQYHPLFRAFLQNRAEASLDPVSFRALRAKAAAGLESAGQIEAAAELLIALEDWPNLSRFIDTHGPKLMADARSQTVAGWVRAIPEELKEQSPDLLYWDGVTRIGIDFEGAQSRLATAFDTFRERSDVAGQYLACCANVECITAAWIDFRPFDRWIDEFKALQHRHPQAPDKEIEVRTLSNIVFAMTHRRICDPELSVLADRLLTIVQEPFGLESRAWAGSSRVAYFCCSGDYGKATMVLEATRPKNRRDGPPQTWILYQSMTMLLSWLTASFDECRRAEKEAIDIIRDTGAEAMEIFVLDQALSCALSENDRARAREVLSRISAAFSSGGSTGDWQQSYPLRWMYHYHFAWYELLEGKLSVAREHAAWSMDYADKMGDLFIMMSHIALANIAIDVGDAAIAETHLVAITELDRDETIAPVHVTRLMAEADLARRTGDRDKCLTALRQGFAVARAHDLKSTQFWLSQQMADLCVLALEADIEVDYVRTLVRRRDLRPRTAPRHLDTWPWPLTVQTLGDFTVTRSGETLSFKGKAQRKPLDLLKALIAFGGRGVSIVRLQDALWPDAEGDAAERAFDVTLHRLRKLLQLDGALDRTESRLSLSAHVCWVDVWALDELVATAKAVIGGAPSSASTADIEVIEAKILHIHQGAFLEHLSDEPWASSARDEISVRLMRFFHQLGRYWERQDRPESAIDCYQRGLNLEAPSELLRKRLMRALDRIRGHWKHVATNRMPR